MSLYSLNIIRKKTTLKKRNEERKRKPDVDDFMCVFVYALRFFFGKITARDAVNLD